MKVDDALKGIHRLYLETAPLIYYVEENPAYVTKIETIFRTAASASIELVSSVITLTEVLIHPIRLGDSRLEQEYNNILLNSDGFQLLPVTSPIAKSAAQLRAQYNLRTPDALHVATAIHAGCDAFMTNDVTIKRVTEIPILILGELES
jgi:predicted nucleic acid-binding protein